MEGGGATGVRVSTVARSPRVLLGLDFFGVSMQLSEPVLWSGEPADVELKEWMNPPV